MDKPKLFLLTEADEEGVYTVWTFYAKDKMELATHLVEHDEHYHDLFERMGWRVWHRRYERPSPEYLLKFISDSYIERGCRSNFQLFEVTDLTTYNNPTEVSYTRFDREIWG